MLLANVSRRLSPWPPPQAAELKAEREAGKLRSQLRAMDGQLARQQQEEERQQQEVASKRARLEASAVGDVASLQARASRQGVVQLSVSDSARSSSECVGVGWLS